MRILVYSDLHLEFKAKFEIPPEDSGDVMVLAGDIITFKEMEDLIPFIEKWHKPILFVAGNHEYYTKHDMLECAHRFKEWIKPYRNITFLQDEQISIDDVNFFGGTMWTELNKGNPNTILAVTKAMNDYKIIHNGSVPLRAADTIEFHNDLINFNRWLETIDRNDIQLINSRKIIDWNMSKDNQYYELKKYSINTIPSYFISSKEPKYKYSNFIQVSSEHQLADAIHMVVNNEGWDKLVIKPTVSGSGNNTLIFNSKSTDNKDHLKNIFNLLNNNNVMIQPFLREIDLGEYSYIYINGTVSHAVKRFPGVLNDKKDVSNIDFCKENNDLYEFSEKCIKACNSIANNLLNVEIPVYARIDSLIRQDGPVLMEVELIEPDLFIKRITNEGSKKDVVKKFSKAIKNRVLNNGKHNFC